MIQRPRHWVVQMDIEVARHGGKLAFFICSNCLNPRSTFSTIHTVRIDTLLVISCAGEQPPGRLMRQD